MPSILTLVLAGVLFSILLSLVLVIRNTIRNKTDYEKWLEEAQRQSVVKTRRTFSSS